MNETSILSNSWIRECREVLVASWSGSLLPWEQELTAFKSQLSSAFGRAELRRSASAFVDDLLSGVARKTGWQLAEQVGLERPDRLQSLLGRSFWQADKLRDVVRAEALATLGDPGGVLVVDETGFLKKRHAFGRRRTTVFRYRGTGGELPGWRVRRLAELAGAAGLRWTIEACFQRAKEELGLNHCEARSWHGWHRHMTLCMAAAAFLARLQASLRRTAFAKPNRTSPPLTA